MTIGFRSLGSATPLWDDEFTGFAYPNHKQVIALLASSATPSGNSVLQEGAKGYREAVLSFTAPDTTQKDLVRGYEETSETITYTDADGSTCDVRVLEFESREVIADEWAITVRLQQLTEPVPYEPPVDPPLTFSGTHTDSLGDLEPGDIRFAFADSEGAGCDPGCTLSAVEADRELVAAFDMTITKMQVTVPSPPVADYKWVLRVNGADTELVMDPDDPENPLWPNGFIEGSVAILTGDTFCIRIEKVAPAAADLVGTWTLTYTTP